MPPHSAPPVVCLIMDRLSTGMLSAYGNAWIGTPSFDHLAFSSIVFDQMWLTSPTIQKFYDAVWRGGLPAGNSLVGKARANALDTLLVTDDQMLVQNHAGFEKIAMIEPDSSADDSCTEAEIFFSTTASHLAQVDKPAFVWLHSKCLGLNWDAPYAMRMWYAAEEDPPPPTSRDAPHFYVRSETDPDELLGWAQAYAAQISHWDQCLGQLVEVIDNHAILKDALLLVGGCRGFPLGEHRAVGTGSLDNPDSELYGELLHLPLLCRIPNGPHATRRGGLMQPEDVFMILQQWLNQNVTDASKAGTDFLDATNASRPLVISEHGGGSWSIRTPAWFLRHSGISGGDRELYFKPDDRWEANNVAERCDDVVRAIERLYSDAKEGKSIESIDSLLS